MFSVIDPGTGYTLDLMVRTDRAFSREEFSLDPSYLRRWAEELGLRPDLEHLLQEAID